MATMKTKRVLIGSKAAQHWFPDFREPGDEDYLAEGVSRMREPEIHDCTVSPGLQKIFDQSKDIASPEALYTLKLSHCFWDIHWSKTMADIKFFQEHDVQHDEELFQLLYDGWTTVHGKKRAYLKKKNEDFFKDSVQRKYVHDDIHRAVAYYDRPMFERMKHDTESAYIDHDLFLQHSFEDQCRLCREEIYVVALERVLIPSKFRNSRVMAYKRACKLLLTSMTKGWFPKFIALNWRVLNKPDDHDFVKLFKEKLECSS